MRHARTTQAATLEARGLQVTSPEGRVLFRDLNISVSADQVAVIGRNGGGKSTLLEILSGRTRPDSGDLILRSAAVFVPQDIAPADLASAMRFREERVDAFDAECRAAGLDPGGHRWRVTDGMSRGEQRKMCLVAAKLRASGLLLLDEPTQDLDARGADWLREWLAVLPTAAIVVSHDRHLLTHFRHFFVVEESGCRYIPASLGDLEVKLARDNDRKQREYVRNLNRLTDREERYERTCRRRRRKKNVGRLRELARVPGKAKLNQNKSYAQVSQGRLSRLRDSRIAASRAWARSTRRALAVELPMELVCPSVPRGNPLPVVSLEGVTVGHESRVLLEKLDLVVRHDRLAVTGANGSGKTTLLSVMAGLRLPTSGAVHVDTGRLGFIAQGGINWCLDESLVDRLMDARDPNLEQVAEQLIAHKFPLALASRPMQSLSPGERMRAALICLFQPWSGVELLILDEPTYGLDFVGLGALTQALKAWPGGLVIASHDRRLLADIGVERTLVLR